VKQARQKSCARTEESRRAQAPKIEAPAPKVEKSERVEKEKQVAMFEPRRLDGSCRSCRCLDDAPPRPGLLREALRGDGRGS